MNCCLTIKETNLIHTTTWMNHKNIMLSKRKQRKELYSTWCQVLSIVIEIRVVVTSDWGVGGRGHGNWPESDGRELYILI